MANLFEYLKWRGDVPLSVSPFNEVDNVVLSFLSYTDFGGCVPEDGTVVLFQDVFDAFFSRHTRQEIAETRSLTAKSPLIMDGITGGARFGKMKMCNYVDIVNPRMDEQFSAVTYLLDDGTAFVAYRGTDNSVVGWKEDFNFSYIAGTEGQKRSVRYLTRIADTLSCPLRLGGHSKGGNFAVFAASFCEKEIQDRIEIIYANDSPGFPDTILQTEGYQRILPKILSIIPDSSVIGTLLSSNSTQKVIKSSASGLTQHDALTWETERTGFVPAELSDFGIFVSQTISSWLSGLDDDERKIFTDTLFSLFESTGKATFVELSDDGWKSAERILSAIWSLPKEQQKTMTQLLRQLFESVGKIAGEQFKNLPMIKKIEENLQPLQSETGIK